MSVMTIETKITRKYIQSKTKDELYDLVTMLMDAHARSETVLREALEKALEVCKTTEMASFSLDVKYEIQKIRSVLQEALGATK